MIDVLVWDQLNGEEEEAKKFELDGIEGVWVPDWIVEHFALKYAEADSDGHTDGIYRKGQPIMVKIGPAEPKVCIVYEEQTVTYRAAVQDAGDGL